MTQYFKIHPQSPQRRLIARVDALLDDGAVIVYPTDSCYALGCRLGDRGAMDRISRIREVGSDHDFTLVCRDFSELATYAKVDNSAFRLMRSLTPGPFTFILAATGEVPRRLRNARRSTIGIRVPDHPIVRALLEARGEPIVSSTLILPPGEDAMTDPEEIRDRLKGRVELVIDGGNCGYEPTTVIDLSGEKPRLVRQGKGRSPVLETAG